MAIDSLLNVESELNIVEISQISFLMSCSPKNEYDIVSINMPYISKINRCDNRLFFGIWYIIIYILSEIII